MYCDPITLRPAAPVNYDSVNHAPVNDDSVEGRVEALNGKKFHARESCWQNWGCYEPNPIWHRLESCQKSASREFTGVVAK